jgi:hypothetical protein
MSMSETTGPIDPARLTIEQAARLLTNAYRQQVPAAHVEGDIESGAPTNADGTINLVHYTAWLLSEMNRGD